MTDIGFKRVINKKHPLAKNYERTFVKCKKCKQRAFYDFVPYSLSNPIITTPCGHDFEYHYKQF